jgi:hypothetical protein
MRPLKYTTAAHKDRPHRRKRTMPNIYSINEKMHKLRVKLYPNYLPGGEGTYIARTLNEAAVTIEDICAAMIKRAGYAGNYDELVRAVKLFFKEMMYQLADGFAVNTGYFTLHINVGGTFPSANVTFDPKTNKLTIRFQALGPLRNFLEDIEVIIENYADTPAWISEFIDQEENALNSIFIPGNVCAIMGHRNKIEGDDPSCGLYMVPVLDPSKAVKVTRVVENTPSKITCVIPSSGHSENHIRIITQHSGSPDRPLKTPRILTSSFIITEA